MSCLLTGEESRVITKHCAKMCKKSVVNVIHSKLILAGGSGLKASVIGSKYSSIFIIHVTGRGL